MPGLPVNRYPIYIPSRDRWQGGRAKTFKALAQDGVPFRVVVIPSEFEQYAELITQLRVEHEVDASVVVLPDDGYRLREARNFIRDLATAQKHARHWQLDDNIAHFARVHGTRRIRCDAGAALAVVEDFTDRYDNVAVSGLAYYHDVRPMSRPEPPFRLNVRVYSCSLINHAFDGRWRTVRNDDTDLCLQALASGEWTTVQVVAFMHRKAETMTVKGGNTDALYQDDGRLEMADELARRWPGVVSITRRFGRPQHYVDWTKFTTPLRKRADAPPPRDYGLHLRATKPIKSAELRRLVEEDDA